MDKLTRGEKIMNSVSRIMRKTYDGIPGVQNNYCPEEIYRKVEWWIENSREKTMSSYDAELAFQMFDANNINKYILAFILNLHHRLKKRDLNMCSLIGYMRIASIMLLNCYVLVDVNELMMSMNMCIEFMNELKTYLKAIGSSSSSSSKCAFDHKLCMRYKLRKILSNDKLLIKEIREFAVTSRKTEFADVLCEIMCETNYNQPLIRLRDRLIKMWFIISYSIENIWMGIYYEEPDNVSVDPMDENERDEELNEIF